MARGKRYPHQWSRRSAAKGVSLDMLKAITNGRGDEVVELAQTNLR
jgi:hypothetical protein